MSQESLFPEEGQEAPQPAAPPEKVSSLYEPDFDRPIHEDVEHEQQEPQRPEREEPEREEIPEYDAATSQATMTRFADEAAEVHARARMGQIDAELAKLPARMPTEEDLLRMSESDRMMLMRAFARREQLEAMKSQVIPQEYRQIQEINRQKAKAVVDNQREVFQKYPERAHKILEAARHMNDTGKIGVGELSNPEFYELLDTMLMGQEQKEKASRSQLRKVAQGASTAGRSSNAPDRGAIEGGQVENFGKSPRQVYEHYLKIGFSEDMARSATNRVFGK